MVACRGASYVDAIEAGRWVLRATRILLVIVTAMALAACRGANEVTASPARPADALTYSGYDASGREVVTGWIEILYPDLAAPTTSTGSWSLRALVDRREARLGPQVGAGGLEVTFGPPTVVDLNPGEAGEHVVLAGSITVEGTSVVDFEGTWTHRTPTEVLSQGTFRASR